MNFARLYGRIVTFRACFLYSFQFFAIFVLFSIFFASFLFRSFLFFVDFFFFWCFFVSFYSLFCYCSYFLLLFLPLWKTLFFLFPSLPSIFVLPLLALRQQASVYPSPYKCFENCGERADFKLKLSTGINRMSVVYGGLVHTWLRHWPSHPSVGESVVESVRWLCCLCVVDGWRRCEWSIDECERKSGWKALSAWIRIQATDKSHSSSNNNNSSQPVRSCIDGFSEFVCNR